MMNSAIKQINSLEIIDSRGKPTIRTTVHLANGIHGSASVPSGASTGSYEAVEARDNDPRRYHGNGVQAVIEKIHTSIAPTLIGRDVLNQSAIDEHLCALDGTSEKSTFGANAILSISLAVAYAASHVLKKPLYSYLSPNFKAPDDSILLPIPFYNMINGGKHANNSLSVQEFMVAPIRAHSFSHAIQIGSEIYTELRGIIHARGMSTAVGDEGGFAPNLENDEAAFALLIEATEKAGYKPGHDVAYAIDAAAQELYSPEKGVYTLTGSDSKTRPHSKDELLGLYEKWVASFPLISIEDSFAEDDDEGWRMISSSLSDKIQIIGDDLFVTNQKRLQHGIQNKLANSILIKPNQVGTLTETINTIILAQKNNYKCMISHRSGETEDTTIADLAVASRCAQIKSGALCRSDRVAKYNRLLEIEAECLTKSHYLTYNGTASL